jgi:stress response protein SCP2
MRVELPKNPEEKHAMVKAMFFAEEYAGINVTDRIRQLAPKLGMSTTNLYVTYYPRFKTDYELHMRAYAQKRQDEAAQNEAIRVLGVSKPGHIEDANMNSAAMASNMVHNMLQYKAFLLQQLLEKIQAIISQTGGNLANATPAMILQLKSLDKDVDNLMLSVKSYVAPEKVFHYLNNITNSKALGAGGNKVFVFSEVLRSLAETDVDAVKDLVTTLFPGIIAANTTEELTGLAAVSAVIERNHPNLPDISGELVEAKPEKPEDV